MPPPVTPVSTKVTALYGPEFAADPYAVYERLRRYGALAPVEIAPGVSAMLVLDHRAALELLHDTSTWSKDPRRWQETLPPGAAVPPALGWRPHARFQDGEPHLRCRRVITDSFSLVEPEALRGFVRDVADSLIARFAADGSVELIGQYARMLPLLLFERLFGVPEDIGARLASALTRMSDGRTVEETAAAGTAFEDCVRQMLAERKQHRGRDLTTWFLEHPAGLREEEVVQQIVLTMSAGHAPTTNLIGNALARMLSDDRYYSTLSSGALTVRDAIHDVLRNEPPIANLSAHYPVRDVFFHGTWIRAGQLVMVSYAAAGTQHGRTPPGQGGGAQGSGGGAHLAWAAGPHACPVRQPALLIATTAIERLTTWLSDIELTVPHDRLTWRGGPFHRALAALPARFTPLSPDQAGVTPWDSGPSPAPRTGAPAPQATPEGVSGRRKDTRP